MSTDTTTTATGAGSWGQLSGGKWHRTVNDRPTFTTEETALCGITFRPANVSWGEVADYAGRYALCQHCQRATGPMAGDAVRLVAPAPGMPELEPGAVGVIGGMVGERIDGGSITFRASTYRDDRVVSCSGGPATIHTDAAELRATGETATLRVWRFKGGMRRAGNAEEYTVKVPVWDWHPRGR